MEAQPVGAARTAAAVEPLQSQTIAPIGDTNEKGKETVSSGKSGSEPPDSGRSVSGGGGDGLGGIQHAEPARTDQPARLDVADVAGGVEASLGARLAALGSVPGFMATRGTELVATNEKPVSSLESDAATCGTNNPPRVASGKWQVDTVRASENTYAFRLRWAEGKKRGTPLYIKRVSATVFATIKKGNYEGFKQQLIATHVQSSLRASDSAS